MLTKYINNSQHIRADSARMDWSKAVQPSSVQVPKNWGLVRARSKNFSDWIGLDLDGPGPDWSIAGLVESLMQRPAINAATMIVDRAHAARKEVNITGILLKDIKAAFPNVMRGSLIPAVKAARIDGDLI